MAEILRDAKTGRILKGNTSTLKHGQATTRGRTRIYTCWRNMMSRCYQPSSSRFKNYGARGITVCERWHSFENFSLDMGEPPAGHSIDRENVNGHYEPANCRWLPNEMQTRNQTRNLLVTLEGKTQCVADWARETGIGYRVIWKRIRKGWKPERALRTPSKHLADNGKPKS